MMKRIIISCCCLLLVTLILSGASKAAPELFELSWWTVDGGGGASQGGSYALAYTIGQPDAGYLTGGDFTLRGGFALRDVPAPFSEWIYLPLVMNK